MLAMQNCAIVAHKKHKIRHQQHQNI